MGWVLIFVRIAQRDGLGVVLLADAPIFSVACTPWRFLSQVPGYPKYDERQRDAHHIVSLVFAIAQPSPLYVEGDFFFLILLFLISSVFFILLLEKH